jgi:hypothetical protein
MSTTRTPIGRLSKPRITAEAIELFRRAYEIEQAGDASEIWEESGGQRRAYLNVSAGLYELLGLQIWERGPLEVDVDDDEVDERGGVRNTQQAVQLRRELLKALAT